MKRIILLILTIALITGCKKYEEGPYLSLRSKMKRISGKWYLYEANYSDTSYYNTGQYMEIESYDDEYDDGEICFTGDSIICGYWHFSPKYGDEKNKYIEITFTLYTYVNIPDFTYSTRIEISRLTTEDLWLKPDFSINNIGSGILKYSKIK